MSDGFHADPFLVLDPGRHTAQIWRLDADREGRFLVTASGDKTVRVWAAADGRLLRTLRLPAGPGNVGKAYAAAISPDGALVAVGGFTGVPGTGVDVYLFDRASGRLLRRVGELPSVVNHLAFSPDGARLAAALGGGKGVRLIDPAAGQVVAADAGYGGASYGAAFDPAGSGRLATTSLDGKVRLYGPGLRLLRAAEAPGGKQPFDLAFSPDGRRLAVGYADTVAVDVLDAGTLQRLVAADNEGVDNGNLFEVAWSADGGSLHAAGRWHVGGEHRLRRWPGNGLGAPVDLPLSRSTVITLRGLPDGRLAFAAADPRLGLLGTDGVRVWEVGPATADFRSENALTVSADGMQIGFGYKQARESSALFSLTERRLDLSGSAEGRAAARISAESFAIKGWKDGTEPTLDGKRLALKPYETSRSLAVAPDGRRFVLGSEWRLRLYDRDGKELWRRPAPGVAWAVNVSGDGRLAVAAYGDGTIRWHRLSDGEELLAFYPHSDRQRWVLWTPKGYYDASPGAEDLIGWQVNRGRDEAPEFFTASRFRERFHRPDVIDRVLQELDIDRAVAAAAKAVRPAEPEPPAAPATILAVLPPTVAIVEPQEGALAPEGELIVTYTVTASERDPPTKVKLLVDGERVNETDLPLSVAGPRRRRLIVELPPGGSLLTLMARNAHGWSDPVTVRLGRAVPPAPAVIHRPTANLFVLAVGVDRYKHYAHLNLRYAVADAEGFCGALTPQEGGLYKRVEVRPLVDEGATWEEILDGFEWLTRHMTSEDVAMVLLAGHGVNDAEGAFHFVPHDASLGKSIHLKRTCIGHDYLRETLRTLADRGKTLLFLDACHAGGLIPDTRAIPPDIGAVANDLAQAENGVIVFAACEGGQVALEKPDWGNGAMTKALLEAFSGKARRDGDRLLVSDIADYVKARVGDLTERAQTPVVLFPRGRYTNPPVYLLR